MSNFILNRKQRELFNLHWKSLIAQSHVRPVDAEVFVELILMRYPVENVQNQLLRAFAPSMPSHIRAFIKCSGNEINAAEFNEKIEKSFGYQHYRSLWKALRSLRNQYFGMFHFTGAALPTVCNKLLISRKVWLEKEQLEMLLTCLDGNIKFLRQRMEVICKKETPTDFECHDFGPHGQEPMSDETFHALAAGALLTLNRK